METTGEILVSLEPVHAENILLGRKDIELRTRRMHLERNARVWMYSKKPIGAIVGFALLKEIIQLRPADMWRCFGARTCISERQFYEYFSRSDWAYGLVLSSPSRLRAAVSLTELRNTDPAFSPPQFFKRIHPTDRIQRLLALRRP